MSLKSWNDVKLKIGTVKIGQKAKDISLDGKTDPNIEVLSIYSNIKDRQGKVLRDEPLEFTHNMDENQEAKSKEESRINTDKEEK